MGASKQRACQVTDVRVRIEGEKAGDKVVYDRRLSDPCLDSAVGCSLNSSCGRMPARSIVSYKSARARQDRGAPNRTPEPLFEEKWATMTCRRLRSAFEPRTMKEAARGLRDSVQASCLGSMSPEGQRAVSKWPFASRTSGRTRV